MECNKFLQIQLFVLLLGRFCCQALDFPKCNANNRTELERFKEQHKDDNNIVIKENPSSGNDLYFEITSTKHNDSNSYKGMYCIIFVVILCSLFFSELFDAQIFIINIVNNLKNKTKQNRLITEGKTKKNDNNKTYHNCFLHPRVSRAII